VFQDRNSFGTVTRKAFFDPKQTKSCDTLQFFTVNFHAEQLQMLGNLRDSRDHSVAYLYLNSYLTVKNEFNAPF